MVCEEVAVEVAAAVVVVVVVVCVCMCVYVRVRVCEEGVGGVYSLPRRRCPFFLARQQAALQREARPRVPLLVQDGLELGQHERGGHNALALVPGPGVVPLRPVRVGDVAKVCWGVEECWGEDREREGQAETVARTEKVGGRACK